MPIYEYRCQSCGHEEEVLQKVSDPLLTDCPACQQPTLKKKVSAAGFRLKGGGWYETDFKSDNKRNVVGEKSGSEEGGKGAGKEGDKKADTSGTSDSKTSDSKTEKKSEAKASTPKTDSKSGGTSASP